MWRFTFVAFIPAVSALSAVLVGPASSPLRPPIRTRSSAAQLSEYDNSKDIVMWSTFPGTLDSKQSCGLGNDEPSGELDLRFRLPQRYSTKDWLQIMWQTPRSRVLKRIMHPVLCVVTWSLLVWLVQRRFALPGMSFLPHNLIGSALSLLLVFRTNAAYTRFWEGRQRWQVLSDHVRSLARLCMLYREQLGPRRTARIARLLCAFPVILKQYLRGSSTEETCGAVAHLLGEAERASLARTRNKPLHACNLIAQQIGSVDETPLDPTGRTLTFSSRERLAMLSQVADLSDCIGACERIVQTPVPLHYARHTSRLATLFIFTLPLVLTAEMGLLTVPCMAIICWALYAAASSSFLAAHGPPAPSVYTSPSAAHAASSFVAFSLFGAQVWDPGDRPDHRGALRQDSMVKVAVLARP